MPKPDGGMIGRMYRKLRQAKKDGVALIESFLPDALVPDTGPGHPTSRIKVDHRMVWTADETRTLVRVGIARDYNVAGYPTGHPPAPLAWKVLCARFRDRFPSGLEGPEVAQTKWHRMKDVRRSTRETLELIAEEKARITMMSGGNLDRNMALFDLV